jgi:hypothetical protein
MSIKKVAFEFDPIEETGAKVPRAKRREALEAVEEFVRDEVLKTVGEGRSPVAGGSWKRGLSPGYKKRKGEESSADYANLELHGDLLDALEVVSTRGGRLSLQVEGDQAPKAYGHNTGYEGHPTIKNGPKREFIPKKGQTFKKDIWRGIKRILSDYEE